MQRYIATKTIPMTLPGPDGDDRPAQIHKGNFAIAELFPDVAASIIENSADFQAALAVRLIRRVQHTSASAASTAPKVRPTRGLRTPVAAGHVLTNALRRGVAVSDAPTPEPMLAPAPVAPEPAPPAAPEPTPPTPEPAPVPAEPESTKPTEPEPAPVEPEPAAEPTASSELDEHGLPLGAPNAATWKFDQVVTWLKLAGLSPGQRTTLNGVLRLTVGVKDPRGPATPVAVAEPTPAAEAEPTPVAEPAPTEPVPAESTPEA